MCRENDRHPFLSTGTLLMRRSYCEVSKTIMKFALSEDIQARCFVKSSQVRPLRSRKELEYSRTLRTLDTNAANPVAINRYQYVHVCFRFASSAVKLAPKILVLWRCGCRIWVAKATALEFRGPRGDGAAEHRRGEVGGARGRGPLT